MRNLSPQRSPTQDANLREESKAAYQRGDFEEALRLYKTLLASTRDSKERQLLLSNIVACRLNIGGSAQAEAAVDNAKQVSRGTTWYFFPHSIFDLSQLIFFSISVSL